MTVYEYEKPKHDYDKPKRSIHDAPLAGIGRRFVALVIDHLLVGLAVGILSSFIRNGAGAGGFFLLLSVIYQWYFLTQRDGQTIGKMIMNIRVVKVGGEPLTVSDVILRMIGYWVNGLVFGLGWIWALVDKDRQGWHDKIAQTYVVEA